MLYLSVSHRISLIKLSWSILYRARLVEVTHLTPGKKAEKQELCGKGMTSVKQNNDTALKSTCSHVVIGEGLIQPLQ